MRHASTWLETANSGELWANLLLERPLFPPGAQRHAFELGFLSRIHQRLCSPLGGEGQAHGVAVIGWRPAFESSLATERDHSLISREWHPSVFTFRQLCRIYGRDGLPRPITLR